MQSSALTAETRDCQEALASSQRVVRLNESILADHGIVLQKDAMILDFGCGSGRHVYEHIDHGYTNVFGYDVQQYLSLRDPSDEVCFRLEPGTRMTAIPFADDQFDFVYSNSVFEHVIEQEKALREIYRVLKPGGASLHTFPSRWRPLEPHLFVPFGGAFRSYAYYRFWTALGIGAKFGGETDPARLATIYAEFGRTGLCYPSGREIDELLARCFDSFSYASMSFLRWSPGRSGKLYPLVRTVPVLERLFRFLHTRVVLLRKKAHTNADAGQPS